MQQKSFIAGLPVFQTLDRLTHRDTRVMNLGKVSKSTDALSPPLSEIIRKLTGKPQRYPETIGTHPDFARIPVGGEEIAPITSVFIDIRRSTALHFEFSQRQVKEITQALLETAAIVVQAFDGHVHRFQGDGLLAFFGRKGLTKESTIVDALTAVSVLLIIVETELKRRLKEMGVEPIQICVGVDHEAEALWSTFGSRFCTETTACGLHISLASKLQGKAGGNEIMIGDAIREIIDLPEEFIRVKKIQENGKTIEKPLVVNRQEYRYRMWQFDWRRYASYFTWIRQLGSDRLCLPSSASGEIPISLSAYVLNSNGEKIKSYQSGMELLPKGTSLRFELSTGYLPPYRSIEWSVENRGLEATDADCVKYEVENSKNRTAISRETAYLGHHLLICRVTFNSGKVSTQKIGVFVGREWLPQEEFLSPSFKSLSPRVYPTHSLAMTS